MYYQPHPHSGKTEWDAHLVRRVPASICCAGRNDGEAEWAPGTFVFWLCLNATKLIVTRHRGGTMEFELIDPIDSDPTTDQDARLTKVLDRNGRGSTITYSGSDSKIDKVLDYCGVEMSHG